ncbi:MAG: hypothetical protein IVW52_05215 [Acidimicrobiales bacterium]|nr:hypothetical protein [Acidimicrobiales bacterium]
MVVDAYDFLSKTMSFTIPDVTSRVLGQQLIEAGPEVVLQFWRDPRALAAWGNPTVDVPLNRSGLVAPWVVIRVLNIVVGTDQAGNAVLVSVRFWGQSPGVSTVVTRIGWYVVPIQHLVTNLKNRLSGKAGVTLAPVRGPTGAASTTPLTRLP